MVVFMNKAQNICKLSEEKKCSKRNVLGLCIKNEHKIDTKGNCKEVLKYKKYKRKLNINFNDLSLIKNNLNLTGI